MRAFSLIDFCSISAGSCFLLAARVDQGRNFWGDDWYRDRCDRVGVVRGCFRDYRWNRQLPVMGFSVAYYCRRRWKSLGMLSSEFIEELSRIWCPWEFLVACSHWSVIDRATQVVDRSCVVSFGS